MVEGKSNSEGSKWVWATPENLSPEEMQLIEEMRTPFPTNSEASHDAIAEAGGGYAEESFELNVDPMFKGTPVETFLVLMAVQKLEGTVAYGKKIADWLNSQGVRSKDQAVVYTTLKRLLEKGLIQVEEREITRGEGVQKGYKKRNVPSYTITPKGRQYYQATSGYLMRVVEILKSGK